MCLHGYLLPASSVLTGDTNEDLIKKKKLIFEYVDR